jgi:hypothetical protein
MNLGLFFFVCFFFNKVERSTKRSWFFLQVSGGLDCVLLGETVSISWSQGSAFGIKNTAVKFSPNQLD